MATIMCLPEEVISVILSYNDIRIEDIINFRCVCKQFQWAAKNDKCMKKKFLQRWPLAKKLYDKQFEESKQKESDENEEQDKKSLNFIETGIFYTRQLRNYVSQIIHKYCSNTNEIHNSIQFKYMLYHADEHLIKNIYDIFMPENFVKCCFFIDEIKNLLMQSPQKIDCNLTERYCNTKIFRCLRQHVVSTKLRKYTEKSYKNQFLERIFTMAAQWFQPEKDIFYSSIKASLDNIALEILDCLREKHPDHSILSMPPEMFSYWKNNNINDNHWNEMEGMQILDTLEEYIFDKLKFQLNIWNDENLEYICIDNVLKNKHGNELILLIIYLSVARRLGLRCDIICKPYYSQIYHDNQIYHFCIAWKPNYATSKLEDTRYFNLKIFPDIPRVDFIKLISPEDFDELRVINPMKKTTEMFWQELTLIVLKHCEHYNCTFRIMLNRILNRRIEWTRDEKIYLSLHIKETKLLHTRVNNVKFAVGMIVMHQPEDCVGVIVGWHQKYDGHFLISRGVSSSYKYINNLNHCFNYNFIKQQTNYLILTENNKMCYVEEDAITLITPKWIDNSEIGRYFCTFKGTHYVPNKMLARLYPQDAAITTRTILSKN